jgi:putative hydrolase of the HAD superfamily
MTVGFMVLIFDLDDTLYDEMSFVESGLYAVAYFGETTFGWDPKQSFDFMKSHLIRHGRGAIFDEWLRLHGRYSDKWVASCVKVYRHHQPNISVFDSALKILEKCHGKQPIYLVTDGHKIVQKNKIEALNIKLFFKRIFITHRFGIKKSKPSLHCFEIIRRSESCQWSDMIYVGDNPAKDFVNLNKVGAMTVRVNTGSYASTLALPGYDGKFRISDLTSIPLVLDQWHKLI